MNSILNFFLPTEQKPKQYTLFRIRNENELKNMFDMVGLSQISVRYFKNNYPEEHILNNGEVDSALIKSHTRDGNYITYNPEKSEMNIGYKNGQKNNLEVPYTDDMVLSYIILGDIRGSPSILLIHSDYPDEATYMAEHPKQDGGMNYIIYNKRKYKVCTGKRGGKYIRVGKDKKIIYI